MYASGTTVGPTVSGLAVLVTGPRDLLDGIQTTEERLLVTLVILVAAFVAVTVVVPWLARLVDGPRGTPDDDDQAGDPDTAEAVRSGVRVLFARGLQLGVLLAAATALLLLWDRMSELQTFLGNQDQTVRNLLGNGVITLVVALVAYVAMDVLDETVARFSEGADRVTDHQEEVIRRVGQLSIMALALATVLAVWVENLEGLLVGAGFLGIVVGMAARQTLGSLIAGFVLMFSRPFTIGDWVEIGDQEGIVTEITIVNTRLENFDGEFVVLPNDMVGNQPITNRSQKGHLRLRQEVGVDYDSDPDHAREVALDALADLDAIEPSPPPQAILTEFGDSAVVIELRFWIDRPTPPRKWRATNDVVQAVHDAFECEGIKIPFPQRELSGRAETGGFQVASPAPGTMQVDGDAGRGPASAPQQSGGEDTQQADGDETKQADAEDTQRADEDETEQADVDSQE